MQHIEIKLIPSKSRFKLAFIPIIKHFYVVIKAKSQNRGLVKLFNCTCEYL